MSRWWSRWRASACRCAIVLLVWLGLGLGPAAAWAAAGVPVLAAWQPVAAAGGLPSAAGWQPMEPEQANLVERGTRGAWLRLAPASGRWPDEALAVELRLRALGDVALVDGHGATTLVASLDTPRPGVVRGLGVTMVPIARPADRAAPVLLRLEPRLGGPPVLVDATVRTAADETAANNRRLAFTSACLAVLLCTALYALLFGQLMRDATYLHYAAYVLGFAVLQSLVTGFAVNVLEFECAGLYRPWLTVVSVGVSTWGAARFLAGFVDLSRHAPRLARGLRWLADGQLAFCLSTLLPVPALLQVLRVTINPLLIVVALAMLAASLVALARGAPYVRVYLLGWLPLLGATIVDSAQGLGAFASWTALGDTLLAAGTFETVVLVFAITLRARDLRSDRDRTRRMAETDGLTGVLNRRGWERRLEHRLARARQRHDPVGLLFLDLDHFKAFNDRHGHGCGDRLLAAVAQAIARELRPGDVLGRYGGEEFVIVLPGCDAIRAHGTAERIRARVEALVVPVGEGIAGTTASIGITVVAPGEPRTAAIARADAAMYDAKRTGRNRAVAAAA